MTATAETMQGELSAIVGEHGVSADAEVCRSFAVDGIPPKLLVYPSSAEEVAAVLQHASKRALAVIPVRNGTKLGVGNPPRQFDLALSLKNLNRIWHYEPADLTVVVEPGMKLGDFEHFLARDGLWLPLDPRGGERASIGGILATNAAGALRARYGAPRDMTLGMKIATAEGKIIHTGGRVVKNVAGYDVGKLVIGSRGTLGVIVEACFKLFTRPAGRATFVCGVPNLDAARNLRRAIFASPLEPLRMALLDGTARRLVLGNSFGLASATPSELELWFEAGGSDKVLSRYAREMETLAHGVGATLERQEGVFPAWDCLADFTPIAAEACKQSVILRASLPLDSSEEFLGQALDRTKSRTFVSQPGTGVVTLVLPLNRSDGVTVASPPKAAQWVAQLRSYAEGLAGALVVEHAPPEWKPALDVWGQVGNDVEIMRQVKAVWDPKGVLSPGRFAGGI